MSETTSSPESATGPIGTTATKERPVVERRELEEPRRPSRLNVVAAWVGIVAGAVFIVAVIFGTGFVLGAHAGGGHHRGGGEHGGSGQMHRQGPPMFGPRPGSWGPGGPGGQQGGPGGSGPGAPGQGPNSIPSTQPSR